MLMQAAFIICQAQPVYIEGYFKTVRMHPPPQKKPHCLITWNCLARVLSSTQHLTKLSHC